MMQAKESTPVINRSGFGHYFDPVACRTMAVTNSTKTGARRWAGTWELLSACLS